MTARHDARLVPVAAAAWGTGAVGMAGGVAAAVAVAIALLAAGAAASATRLAPRALTLLVVLGGVSAVVAAASVALASSRAAPLADAAGSTIAIRAVATSDAVDLAIGAGLDARVDVVATVLDGEEVAFPVTLIGSDVADVMVGDRVTAEVRVPPDVGAFDVVLWRPAVVAVEAAAGWNALVPAVREGFRSAAAGLPDRTRGLVLGMVIGDTSQMPPHQLEQMRVAGLTHLTAVSGSHFAVLASAVGWLTTRLVPSRTLRAALMLASGIAFTALVLPQPSVVRALTMVAAIAAGVLLGRRASALPALAAGVAVLIVVDPSLSVSYGFAMSVAAVVALVLWAPRLALRLERFLWPRVARLLAIPVAAHLAVAPIIVLFDPGVGPYSTPANLLAVPFVAPVTVLGLVAVVVAAVDPATAEPLTQLVGVCAEPVAAVAAAVAAVPGAWVEWPAGWAGAALLTSVTAAAVMATVAEGSAVRTLAAAVGLAMAALGASATRHGPAAGGSSTEQWAAVVCDVGQGSMAMIRAGPASAVVVDTGAAGAGGAECLSRFGVASVPLLVLSHPHADHDGAVSEILAVATVDRAWVSRSGADGVSGAAARLETAGVPVEVPTPGIRAAAGDVDLTVLSAMHAYGEGGADSDLNDGSIVVLASSEGVETLLPGDLETAGQGALAAGVSAIGTVDLLLVPHHGSATQVVEFARAVNAAVAVISVGADNDYGHPAASAIDLFAPHAGVLLRTDECGDVVVAGRQSGAAVGVDVEVAAGCPIGVAG